MESTKLARIEREAGRVPANDNRVQSADFPDLAARRAWLDSLPKERVRITTTPTRKRLAAANDNRRQVALDAVDTLLLPARDECLPEVAEVLDEAAVGQGWRIRPSIGEIRRAMRCRVAVRSGLGRTHAERSRNGTIHIGGLVFTRTRRAERGPVLVLGEVVTGNIVVPAGAMIQRGTSDKGGSLRPGEFRTFERRDKEEKAKAELDSRRAIRAYLGLGGSWGDYVSWADRLGGPPHPLDRPTAAIELSAAYRNTAMLPSITSLPTGYCWKGHWHGGAMRPAKGGASTEGHARHAHDVAIRILLRKWLCDQFDEDEMRILALATSSASAIEAGADLGMTRQRYVAAANDALDKVARLLAA